MSQIFIECRIMVGGAHVQTFTFSSQDHGRLSIVNCVVWCGMCGVRVVCVVCCACVLKWLCVCVESVSGVCAESVWDVRFVCRVLWCIVVCVSLCVVCVGAGVGVQCVVRGAWCVCGAAWHAEKNPVCMTSPCTFKTPPCVPAKRAHVFNMRTFCRHTQRRFAPTHGDVLSIHTERREGVRGGGGGGGEGFLSSLSPLFPLLSSLSSLSATMTMNTGPVGLSLCTHGSNLPECQSACTLAHSLFGRTCPHCARNNCPGMVVQASCHLE